MHLLFAEDKQLHFLLTKRTHQEESYLATSLPTRSQKVLNPMEIEIEEKTFCKEIIKSMSIVHCFSLGLYIVHHAIIVI